MDEMGEIVQEFLVESYENLDRLDQDFVALEENPEDRDRLASIFRTIHTVKGTSGFLGFSKLEALTHVGESLLSLLRDGTLKLSPAITTALLAMIDAVRSMLNHIESGGNEGERDYLELIAELARLQTAPPAPSAPKSSAESATVAPAPAPERAKSQSKPKSKVKSKPAEARETLLDPSLALEAFMRDVTDSDGEPSEPQVEHDEPIPEPLVVKAQPPAASSASTATAAVGGELGEIVQEFLVESYENLDRLDQAFVALEENPEDSERLQSIFRTIHTLKGTSGFLGLSKLEALTHVGESLLSLLRDGTLRLSPDITTALLAMIDAVRAMLSNIESSGSEGERDYLELIAELSRLQTGGQKHEVLPAASATAVTAPPPLPPAPMAEPSEPAEAQAPNASAPSLKITAAAADGSADGSGGRNTSVADQSIRVDVHLLDDLMNLVGELVLARNHILQFVNDQQDPNLIAASQRLNLIASELQEGVMKTRMQPIGNIWNKFPRVVRDLATACGKKVRVEMEGKETDLDKTLIETIKDPLTHLVRNSVDHGIESPEERVRQGKPEEGVLLMRAYHEGGQVNIEISDDGGGINVHVVKTKALERGLITPEQYERMNDREAVNLIFLPGFSTAKKVTNVSGRGVGMDVVKTNIEKIGGLIDIQNRPGNGTTIKVKIPLTLAIVPALIITCERVRYAIPQISLLELVRLEGDQARAGIEQIHGAPVYRLRGRLLPLVYLRKVLQLPDPPANSEVINILVLQAYNQHFGLIVDEVNDTQEIVVKPLGRQLKNIHSYAGATIMGDGSVALILDVMGIAESANVMSKSRERLELEHEMAAALRDQEQQALILLRGPDDGRMAVRLDQIERLEMLLPSMVEHVGEKEVLQYRGEIIPLIDLAAALPERRISMRSDDEEASHSEKLHVLIYRIENKTVGLRVDRILDIVQQEMSVTGKSSRLGVTGTVVIKDRVTEILDIEQIVRHMEPELLEYAVSA